MGTALTFGDLLKRHRKQASLTQDELAHESGYGVSLISQIERGKHLPPWGTRRQLYNVLQLSETQCAELEQLAYQWKRDSQVGHRPVQDSRSIDTHLSRWGEGDILAPTAPTVSVVQPHAEDKARAGSPATLPSGTVTFLLTDIEGSSQLWEQHEDAMPATFASHHTMLSDAIGAHGGVIFKTTGDGIRAVFASARAALAAALDAQKQLSDATWSAVGALQVRIALLTGDAQPHAGDYIGPPLNRAARLLDAGHGGQVLLSSTTKELVREHLPRGVELRDLGRHRLRGMAHPEHIFQVLAPNLPASFPPLNTLRGLSTNIPASVTSLVGREREMARVRGLLRRSDVRLLTLTGPGGVGKTRLALQVASELLDDFTSGVFFIQLGSIRVPDLLASTINETLDVREVNGQLPTDTLKAFLRNRNILLVLDNFEQLLDAAPMLTELLVTGPGLKLMVTSREALRISGEHKLVVPPLTLPDLARLPPLEQLLRSESVWLFAERARAVRPDFTLTEELAPVIAEICHRVDGLPLAIELAAVRIKSLSLAALLERLRQPLALLTVGARDLPQRHQTLERTVDWSFQLLDPAVQQLFMHLAVFIGGCTLKAAMSVCILDAGQLAVEDGIDALVDKSLLMQLADVDGEPRYGMLETIREYAWKQLKTSGEIATMRAQHAAYYLALAEVAESKLHGPDQKAWLSRLTMEHDNLRATLVWSLEDRPRATLGLRLASALWHFWEIRGHLTEGEAWLRQLLDVDASATLDDRAKALDSLATLSSDPDEALKALKESLKLRREFEDQPETRTTQQRLGIAATQRRLGAVLTFHGEWSKARAFLEKSLATCRSLDDTTGTAAARQALGDITRYEAITFRGRGDIARYEELIDQAIQMQAEGLLLWQKQQDQHAIAWSLNNLGWLAYDRNDYGHAAALHRASFHLFREIDRRAGMAASLINLGHIACRQSNYWLATRLLVAGLQCFRELNNIGGIAYALERFAMLAAVRDPTPEGPIRAARLFGATRALRTAAKLPVPAFDSEENDELQKAAQTQLDQSIWTDAYRTGETMLLEQAIDEALALNMGVEPVNLTPQPAGRASPMTLLHQRECALPSPEVLRLVVQRLAQQGMTREV